MNETMEVLMKRKSVRVFEQKDIPAEVKEAILVEGRYDKIKLASLVDGVILEAGGSPCSGTGRSWPT